MNIKPILKEIQKSFLSGVSFMMPAVVAGGIMLAISLATGEKSETGVVVTSELMQNINILGKAAFAMMIPILGGYIAYSIAGKPGLAPGMILGFLANNPVMINEVEVKSGFLGAMLLGVAAGYFVKWIKTWKVSKTIKTILPILIIPTITVLVLGMLYIYVIANPLAFLMNSLTNIMSSLNGSSAILLAVFIGLFGEVDMGGPITKSVSMFTLALMNEGVYEPNGMFRIAVAIPPIGIFLATLFFKKKFTEGDRDAAVAAGIMGCIGITEGAIPFVVSDIKRILPSTMIGTAVGCVIGAIGNVRCFVPHGGFIVLPVVENKIWFVAAIVIGSLVTAGILGFLKPSLETETKEVVKKSMKLTGEKVK
ncbi:PTS fructose transporter subunit IIC [Enterococcus sp. ALS3]|uniref:PTS fructose transporter subunit IIC n=1 Tax=Enterococcus alishanensis TaxID=1303817 RepID=A0ABS6TG83_9ENTE|nr:PTS fructose transporter subunit IIC [Enterococcus alishanensis]MBV7391883.1 PTS fructose transporter subunit IIC [Enterococcus alishanensis]